MLLFLPLQRMLIHWKLTGMLFCIEVVELFISEAAHGHLFDTWKMCDSARGLNEIIIHSLKPKIEKNRVHEMRDIRMKMSLFRIGGGANVSITLHSINTIP